MTKIRRVTFYINSFSVKDNSHSINLLLQVTPLSITLCEKHTSRPDMTVSIFSQTLLYDSLEKSHSFGVGDIQKKVLSADVFENSPLLLKQIFCDGAETKRYQKLRETVLITSSGNSIRLLLETGKFVLQRHLLVALVCLFVFQRICYASKICLDTN